MNQENQYQPDTLFHLIDGLASSQADAIAMHYKGRGTLSHQQLLGIMRNLQQSLYSCGIRPQDRVAVVMPNGTEMGLVLMGVMAGATCAPLNPKYTLAEFSYYLDDLNIACVVVQKGKKSLVRQAAENLNIPLLELSISDTKTIGNIKLEVPKQLPIINQLPTNLVKPGDHALILHTSGTTSRPKIVPLTQQNICQSAKNIIASLALTPQDRCFNIMPLFHIHGIMAGLLAPLLSGGSTICSPGFADDPFFVTQFFPWLAELQPTWYTAVPTMHQAILAIATKHKTTVANSRLRFIRSSSSSLPPQVMSELENMFNTPVIEAYGMTEAAHQMASNPLPPEIHKAKSVGKAAGPEVAIMDEQGTKLKTGDIGEIVINGDNIMSAYENNDIANKTAFFGKWFRTGDQGYLDHENYLFITGRLKEQINRGGEKISPREIDEVLMDHPAVIQAVTFAAPHPSLGEVAAAAIVLREGEQVDAETLQNFAAEKLAPFKVPNPIIFVKEIPKGPTGKLQRIGLNEKLLLEEVE